MQIKGICLFASMLIGIFVMGQSLTYTGSQVSLQKADVNTDVLLGIVAKKQEEVKKKLLQDLIIKAFNKSKGAEKAFTTYQYLYTIITTITTEKNKTIATREIMQALVQLATVYGVTEYLRAKPEYKSMIDKFIAANKEAEKLSDATRSKITEAPAESSILKMEDEYDISIKVGTTKIADRKETLMSDDTGESKMFNIIMDIVYDLLIDKSEMRDLLASQNIFTNNLKDPRFRIWYQNDNLFKVYTSGENVGCDTGALKVLRGDIDNFFKSDIVNFKQSAAGKLILDFVKDSKVYFSIEMNRMEQLQAILKSLVNQFQADLKTRNLQLVAVITEFIQKYILIEKDEKTLRVDLEAIILAIDQKYNDPNKRPSAIPNWWYLSVFKPRIFLKMGVTRGQFYNDNLLSRDSVGKRLKLESIYYASEKIGLQFNIFNTGYTHAYKVGEPFYYHGKYKVWKRPQAQPLIYRGHIEIYGSGILYNLANLVTEKDFNYMVVGVNAGITFFNGLSLSAGCATPVSVPYPGNNNFWNVSFDIPIVEYISSLVKK